MNLRLPPPKYWQEFEQLCHALWREIWSDPNAQLNGRQGQTQHGVDIFGTPIHMREFSGVQCKDKDGNLGRTLKTDELLAECKKAQNFVPHLNYFSIATTSPRDEDIQREARELTLSKSIRFPVSVWSWDDISNEINFRPHLLKNFFGTAEQVGSPLVGYFPAWSARDQFWAYFNRPALADIMADPLRELLIPVVYELSDNAYFHGKAAHFRIVVTDRQVVLEDNGLEFNPLESLNSAQANLHGHIGSLVLSTFIEYHADKMKAAYERKDGINYTSFHFDEPIRHILAGPEYTRTIDLSQHFGRLSARELATRLDLRGMDGILRLNISKIYNPSDFFEFVRALIELTDDDTQIILTVPDNIYLRSAAKWLTHAKLTIHYY